MRVQHEDKAVTAGFTAAQRAAYEHARRNAAMTAEERDAVGRALVLEAEARVKDDPLRRKLAEIKPTADETKAISEAEAAYEAAVAKRVQARIVAMKAEATARAEGPAGFEPTAATLRVRAAETELAQCEAEAAAADQVAHRIRNRVEARLATARRRVWLEAGGLR